MFLVQEFCSRLKQKCLPLNLGHQAAGSLMPLKNVVVFGQAIDIRQPGAFREQVAQGDFLSAWDSRHEFSHMSVQAEFAFIDEP